jgi:serine/threonine protein kinase
LTSSDVEDQPSSLGQPLDQIRDRYELNELIGRGGMGLVWRGTDRLLRREVAIKVIAPLPSLLALDETSTCEIALREARAAAQVAHPHAVRIYDVLHSPDRPWIVMEYVPSRSLQAVVAADGPASPGYVARIGVAILDALVAAHRVGVLHRDVKPSNVLIGRDGRIALTDFGIAAWSQFPEVESAPVGTPQYVPPERVESGLSLPEGDFWSLGATLYTAVEGRAPHTRETAVQTLAAVVSEPPDPPRRAADLGPILSDLLHREPRRRPSAAEVRRRLSRVAF